VFLEGSQVSLVRSLNKVSMNVKTLRSQGVKA
jgi:hypothetical protein